ncbi:MAG: hypothetical protein KAS13_07860 [Candidatus Omnitrophica bacterium]|nr:hypothetical protein [Candidatus Omnitrophota bacterium]
MNVSRSFKEKKILISFGLFLVLTLSIGSIGISQIYSLSNIIKELGESYLARERVILEMKINNALYAMGVRNYVFWRVSKYLQAASIASDKSFIEKSSSKFKHYLLSYYSLVTTSQQKEWAKTLEKLIKEMETLGGELIRIIDSEPENKTRINHLLMSFENKFYKIDDFLTGTLSENNFQDVAVQLKLTDQKKDTSVLILIVSLGLSLIMGTSISFIVYTSLKKERQRREILVQKMIGLEEDERRNLSRQIHDQLSQDLGALKIYLELIQKNTPREFNEQREKIEKSRKILANLIEKGHNISDLLRPPELDDLGLVESIAALIYEHKKITGCAYNYYRPLSKFTCSSAESLALYRVVQEALTNSAKYSQAKHIAVSLQQKSDIIQLSVSDDGVGFEYKQYQKRPRRRKEDKLKLGLQGIRERIELLGGSLSVESACRKGTKIKVKLFT